MAATMPGHGIRAHKREGSRQEGKSPGAVCLNSRTCGWWWCALVTQSKEGTARKAVPTKSRQEITNTSRSASTSTTSMITSHTDTTTTDATFHSSNYTYNHNRHDQQPTRSSTPTFIRLASKFSSPV